MVRALKCESVPETPFWYMRQAGRYLPEYHEVRNQYSFMDLCRAVDSAVQVSIQPFERFGMDGIIMFSDILTPLSGAGIELHFEEKKGPIIDTVIENKDDISKLREFDPLRDTGFVKEILGKLSAYIAKQPHSNQPALLGFAGAPFTLASYLMEGGTSKQYEKVRTAIFGAPDFYHALAERLTEITIDYLKMQVDAGADAVQIFDSWGGILAKEDYKEFAAPYTSRIIAALKKYSAKPVILFVGNAAHLLPEMCEQSPSAVSLDWRVDPALAREVIPAHIAIQGNMDPLVLYGSPENVKKKTRRVLEAFEGRPGHIFNLGHGIHPKSPLACVEAMVQTVQEWNGG